MNRTVWPWIQVAAVNLHFAVVGGAEGQTSRDRDNAIYFELLGNAAVYSLNYERTLGRSFYVRVGGGYLELPEPDSDEVDGLGMVPLMVGYTTPTAPHQFEFGIGVAPVFTRGNWDDAGILGSDTHVVGTGTLGFRYAPVRSGFLLRVGLTPFFGTEGFSPWGGVSLGHRF